MDLFNPPKLFNYNIMIKNLDFSVFENPTVQVVWEDLPENFTQDKIKSVKYYFQKKYNTTSVNVLTKSKIVETDTTQSIDVSVNISDKNYQLDLIKNFLVSKDYNHMTDDVLSINNMVENKMSGDEENQSQFKKWYIRNIEFSNFLSYGENQKLDFDKLSGIVVVESDPPNFGGKTVLTVDLLMFLFFNETTKKYLTGFQTKTRFMLKVKLQLTVRIMLLLETLKEKCPKKMNGMLKQSWTFLKNYQMEHY